jgi:hypothetical protein
MTILYLQLHWKKAYILQCLEYWYVYHKHAEYASAVPRILSHVLNWTEKH